MGASFAEATEIARDGIGPRIDVTVPTTSGRRRPGIDIHHAALPVYEIGTWSDIPVTSPARTMVDLAHLLDDPDDIEWAVRRLQYRRLFDRQLLELANRRRPNRTISRVLRELAPTGSGLEVAFLSSNHDNPAMRAHRRPDPHRACRQDLRLSHPMGAQFADAGAER